MCAVSEQLPLTLGSIPSSRRGRAGTTPYDGMQAYCFGTVPSTMWWAITTMTTVGYGDCYPITLPGKVFSVITMLTGLIVLALPITVIGNNFVLVNEMFEDDTRALAQSRCVSQRQAPTPDARLSICIVRARHGCTAPPRSERHAECCAGMWRTASFLSKS